jgi:NAD(P)-dependent dehydrogenase (short-subunit alcohol dehydrogenase family)
MAQGIARIQFTPSQAMGEGRAADKTNKVASPLAPARTIGRTIVNRFTGKVALVTGGTGGIGRASALAFAREGASVAITGRREAEGRETCRLIADAGGEGLFIPADVRREADAERMVATTLQRFGRLDAVFNNAGVDGIAGTIPEQTEANFDYVMNVNVKGQWLSMKYEIPALLQFGGGAIVNNSSVMGLVGSAGMSIYSASKHAVIGLTKSAALEFARRKIRVNAVAPGGVQTDMLDRVTDGPDSEYRAKMTELHPVGRIAAPDEIAGAVLWLCSDEASFVTGHVLSVDGGFIAR